MTLQERIEGMERPWQDEEILRELYHDHTQEEIADRLGCKHPTIVKWVDRHDITTGEDFYAQADQDLWQTPDEIADALTEHVDIRLDPCAGLYTFIGDENWTIDVPDGEPPEGVHEVEAGLYDRVFQKDGRLLRCGNDSLSLPWGAGGIAYVNPPFSMKEGFIEKTIEELDEGNIDAAIVLTPSATDVKSWWHRQLVPRAPVTWFSRGRIEFIDPTSGETGANPTFGTALHFLGPMDAWPDSLFDDLDEMGDVVVRWRHHQ